MLLMQASSVTDRWLVIVREIWCVGPLKRWAAQGIIKQAWNWKAGNVLIALGDTDTVPSHGGTPREPIPAAPTLSSRHFINLSERGEMWLCV